MEIVKTLQIIFTWILKTLQMFSKNKEPYKLFMDFENLTNVFKNEKTLQIIFNGNFENLTNAIKNFEFRF